MEHWEKAHPPFPPDCEAWEEFFIEMYESHITKTENIDLLRASLYRCGWLDEARRILMTREICDIGSTAAENGEAWRNWVECTIG